MLQIYEKHIAKTICSIYDAMILMKDVLTSEIKGIFYLADPKNHPKNLENALL